jgi:hypothetical protein
MLNDSCAVEERNLGWELGMGLLLGTMCAYHLPKRAPSPVALGQTSTRQMPNVLGVTWLPRRYLRSGVSGPKHPKLEQPVSQGGDSGHGH